eukprot:XP_019924218.1 PREDICTED: uveal autoantigen with coiled-coil domains and ankyrin repeats isoform X2 [Crassostrea gigas]
MQRSASPTTIDSPNTYITMMPVQGQPLRAFGDDIDDPGLRNGEMSLNENEAENNNVVTADNFANEVDSFQSPTSVTNMAHYQGSEETHNFLSDIQNQSREVSEKNTSAESNDVWREDAVVETTVIASDANSGDDYTSQSVQNENIDHSNINSEEMQRSPSPTTIDSPNSSITSTPVQEQPSRAFGDDVSDSGLRNGEMSLYENEAENDNAVDADNFENEMDSTQSSESRNDMAHYEGSNETLGYNLLSDIQLKTSQEKEIEKLQRELNVKNENLATLQEEMKRRDKIINEKNSENADLLHRCVASETSAEAADDLREQCEDKNHQIETLEGDLASVRNENESLKRHLEEIENVAAYHQRLIDDNKSLNGQIKKAIEEKEELGAKLASRNENNSDLLSNFLEMKKKEEEMAAELKKMQENYQHEKRHSEELSGQLSLRNKEVITTENKYKQEIEELKAKYKTEKDQAEGEKELLKQCVTKLNEGSQQLQAENKRIKDDLQLKSKECGNLKSERLRITGELDAAKKEIVELSNERDKLGAFITTVNDEIRQLRAALELKEAEKNAANECMQKVVREKQEMMYSMGNLQRIELENHQLKHQNMDQSEQITKLHASLQEYGLLRDHIQEYYKALQDSQMELQREKEKSRHINELLSKTGYRLDSMASELNNYRTTTEGYRRSLEEEKEKSNKLERKLDRLTIDNEKLTEERDKCEQKSFEYKDECRSLREDLEKSQAECRDLLSQTQEGASDGTTSLLQGNYFTSTPMGNGFGKPSSQSNFVFGIGGDKMNRKK